MQIKSKLLLVMCIIKGYSLFDYELYDVNDRTVDPIAAVDPNAIVDPNEVKWTMTTELTTHVTDNPWNLKGVCVVRYKDERFRRVTFVQTYQKTYIAECCGGLKNCTRKKKFYRFGADFKPLKPIRRYHQVCCKGYERNYTKPYLPGGNINCLPVCKPQCARATCVAPQNCSCFMGFIKNPDREHECIEGCTSKCEYASCVGFRLCQCDFGYKSVNESYCEPICGTEGCINGDCILPFHCKCHQGYRKDPDDHYLCVPECDNDCGNGTCISPGVCECPPEQEYYPHFSSCLPPLCTNDCGKGKCSPSPTVRCSCPRLYLYRRENDTCIPVCKEACIGGVCMGWDTCLCFKGFHKVNFGCMDKCKNKCGYGKCMPDGECKCDEKLYVKPKNEVQKSQLLYENDTFEGLSKVPLKTQTYSIKIMKCIPRADNCFETGGKVLAPWICKCPEGKRYLKPNLNKDEKYCLPDTDVSAEYKKKMDKIYAIYRDVELIP